MSKTKKRGSSKNKDHGQTKKPSASSKDSSTDSNSNKLQRQFSEQFPDANALWQYEIYDQTMPQEKVTKVKPYWQQLSQDEREQMLRLCLDELKAQAQELTFRSRQRLEQVLQANDKVLPLYLENFVEVLETGIERLKEKGTWKLWGWGDKTFTDMESFRAYVEEHHMSDDMKALMIKDESKMESKAETALRKRMQQVLNHVQNQTKQFQDELSGNRKLFILPKASTTNTTGSTTTTRVDINQVICDKNVELTKYMLTHVGKEHELLNQSILMPVIEYIIEVLPKDKRRTTQRDLAYEDLDSLKPHEIGNICEWLTEKVDGLTAKWKLDPELDEEEEEDEVMGDIDLFQMSEDSNELIINPKWLEHLQDRTLSPDGNPRKSKPEEDPNRVGLLLEWIFGSIVSTAEKAREGAKRILGSKPQEPGPAFQALISGLEQFKIWKECSTQRRELLAQLDTLKEQLQGVDLSRVGVSGPQDHQSPLPQEHIHSVLKRELALQHAKELHMRFGISGIAKDQINLSVEIRQHENQLSKYGSMLDMLRLKSDMMAYQQGSNVANTQQLATEQLEVQAHINATRAALTQLHHKKAKLESQKQAKETEIADIRQCKQALQQLIGKLQQVQKAQSEGSEVDLQAMNDHELLVFNDPNPQAAMQCIAEYFENFWHCAITMRAEEEGLRAKLQVELEISDDKSEELKAVLGHLEMHFLNVSCDDPGTTIGVWIALPMLQDRLEAKAFDFASKLAEEAQSEMLKLVEEESMKVQQSRERKSSKKAKLREKERAQKEKQEAEKFAEQEAQLEAQKEAQKQQQEQQELERKKREEEAQRLRLEEEQALELRRQQLMDGEDNHWKQRMQELQMQKWLSSTLSNEEVEEAAREVDELPEIHQQQDVDNDGYTSDRDIVVEKRYQKVDNKPKRSVKFPNKRNYERNRSINVKQHRDDPLKQNRYQNFKQGHHMNSNASQDWNQDKLNRRNSHPPLRKQLTRNSNVTSNSSMTSVDEKDIVVITSVQSDPLDKNLKNAAVVDETSVVEYTTGQQAREAYQREYYNQQPQQTEYSGAQQQQLHEEEQLKYPPKELVQADDRTLSADSFFQPEILPNFEQAGIGIEIKPIPPSTPPIYPYPPSNQFPLPPNPPHTLTSHHSLPILTQPPIQPPMAPPPMPPFLPPNANSGPLPFPPPWLLPPPQFQMQGGGFGMPPPPQGQGFPIYPPPFPPAPGVFPPQGSEGMAPPPPLGGTAFPPLPKRLNPGAKEFVPFDSDNQDVTTNSPVSDNSSGTNFNYGSMDQNSIPISFGTLMDQVESKCDIDITLENKVAIAPPKIIQPIANTQKNQQQQIQMQPPQFSKPIDLSEIQVRLNLVRGLQNQTGQSNCFVNVIVQSLWHLKDFRNALLNVHRKDVAQDAQNMDDKIFLALWDLFQAFERPLASNNVEGLQSEMQEDQAIVRSDSEDWTLSVKELKTALSELTGGNFVLDEMHDASEVLGEILTCMYRSQRSKTSGNSNSSDPSLPRKLSLDEEKSVCLIDNLNLVARFFGLDIRVLEKDEHTPEKQYYNQFLKFFHFVPAQGLRQAAEQFNNEPFGTVLNFAEQFESISKLQLKTKNIPKRAKLGSLPGVFTIALVWESPNVGKTDISATINAIDVELDLSLLFDGLDDLNVNQNSSYYMQCLVCFYRHHYYAFAFLEELDKWLLFDDEKIQEVGEYSKVQDMIIQNGWQPILFFYEQEESV